MATLGRRISRHLGNELTSLEQLFYLNIMKTS